MQMEKQIERFYELLKQGYDAWIQAGKIVVSALESDPDFADKVHEAHPEVSVNVVLAFDRIGRRALHPKLAMSDSSGAKALQRLSYDLQEKYVDELITVITLCDGKVGVAKKRVFDLEKHEAKQVFTPHHVRTEAEQYDYLQKHAKSHPRLYTRHSEENPAPVQLTPIAAVNQKTVGRYAVRKTLSGIAFEKTPANPNSKVFVPLSGGVAVIEIVEITKKV